MIDPLSPKKIEPVRLKPESLSDRQVAAGTVSVPQQPATDTVSASLLGLSAAIANQGPPVDQSRVSELRSAIADGSYRIEPGRLAAAMLEFASGSKNA